MKTFLKYSVAAGAIIAAAISAKADPTLVVEDQNGGSIAVLDVSPSGTITYTTPAGGDGLWTVVATTGTSYPPDTPGNASTPVMDLSITATYAGNGTAGNNLILAFGNDQFGPSAGEFNGFLSGHMESGTGLPVTVTDYYEAGSGHLPTLGSPIPGGATTASMTVSPFLILGKQFYVGSLVLPITGTLSNPYSLGEEVILTGAAGGSSYSLDASINTVPDGGMTLVFLGSALSGLALLKRKLV